MSTSFKLYSTFLAYLFFFLSFSLQSLEYDSCLTDTFSSVGTYQTAHPGLRLLYFCVGSLHSWLLSFLNCSPLLVSVTCSLWDFLSLQLLLACLFCWLFLSPLLNVQLLPKAQFLALLNSHFSLYDLLYSLGFSHRPFILMICSYKYMPLSLLSILSARIVSNSSWSCTWISDSRCITLTVGLPPQAVFPKLHNDIATLWSFCSKLQGHSTLFL